MLIVCSRCGGGVERGGGEWERETVVREGGRGMRGSGGLGELAESGGSGASKDRQWGSGGGRWVEWVGRGGCARGAPPLRGVRGGRWVGGGERGESGNGEAAGRKERWEDGREVGNDWIRGLCVHSNHLLKSGRCALTAFTLSKVDAVHAQRPLFCKKWTLCMYSVHFLKKQTLCTQGVHSSPRWHTVVF